MVLSDSVPGMNFERSERQSPGGIPLVSPSAGFYLIRREVRVKTAN